jgi:8-oxo-dGTP pyrophosphatase MutT (NUDIX family)
MQSRATTSGFLRHITACNNVRLPGERVALRIGTAIVGWVKPDMARALAGFPEIDAGPAGLTLTEPASLQRIARALAEQGLHRWRGEAFDVRATAGGPVLAQIDRGALPAFGIAAEGVHVNGLVRRAGESCLWIARRAADKALDPGKLDHIVAGGIPAGLDPLQTLIKEAAEEAAIPAELAGKAVPVGLLSYAMERTEGLRRDRLHCYDLELPEDFRPRPSDGEVESFELWPIARAFAAVRDTGAFKFNVNLVLIDLFLRTGMIAGQEALRLRAALDAGAG